MKKCKATFFKLLQNMPETVCCAESLKESFADFSDFIDLEQQRQHELLKYERALPPENMSFIAGVDEAGRGPLAGPVVAAAVCFKSYPFIPFVNDSKKLTPPERVFISGLIYKNAIVGVGIVDAAEIDEINILQASLKAMRLAVEDLAEKPQYVIVDGNKNIPLLRFPQKAVVKGDQLCISIACASIIAKTVRDGIVDRYDELYPQYGFSSHKGYGTKQHLDALLQYGETPVHRKTFNWRKSCRESV